MCLGITNQYNDCYMNASIQLMLGSCMYNFLKEENSVSSESIKILNVVYKKFTQSKTALFDVILK